MNTNVQIVKKGTTIFTAKPFAFVLSSKHRTEKCDNCFKIGKLLKCSGCQYVYYCNQICQREAWRAHKSECLNLKKIFPKIIPDTARLMAKIITKLSKGGSSEQGYYSENKYRTFEDLMSHSEEITACKKRMEHFTAVYGVLLQFMAKDHLPDTTKLIGVFGRICTNSFTILDQEMNSVGVGIYLAPSLLNHSCEPNAATIFEGSTLIIKTLKDLPCLDFSLIYISYIDMMNTTEERRKELQDRYYFWCRCKRCEHPEPQSTAAVCHNPFCTNSNRFDNDKCSQCGHKFSPDFLNTFNEVDTFVAENLKNMKNDNNFELIKECLRKQKTVFHPLNVKHIRTIEAAFNVAINLGFFEEAEKYGLSLIPGYLKYYTKYNPLTAVLYLTLGKIQLYLEKFQDALKSLEECKSILKVTHGEKHTLFSDNLTPLLFQAQLEEIERIL